MSDGHIRYRADIDGLRALAVLPVVLFHGHVSALPGGFVGVDVFFVISGFLICSAIGQELNRGTFSIASFYERRCRRILPALFATFSATSVLASFVLMPPDLAAFGRSLLSSVLFASNLFFWKTSGYFDGMAELKPLLHTWSLSVEEQFYLIVPYVLMATSALCRKRFLLVLLPLALGSFALGCWALERAPSAAFYMLPTRFWEIMLGGLVGLGASTGPRARWLREVLAATGLAAIAIAACSYSEMTPFPGVSALLPCAGGALVIYAGLGGGSVVGRLLSQRPCVFIGKISYSLYLWHWPLFSLYRYQVGRELSALESALLIGASFALAALSWRFIEQPFRRSERAVGRRVVFRSAALGALATATFAGTAMATGGLPVRVPGFSVVAVPGEAEYDAGGREDCFLGDPHTAADWGGERCFITRGRGPTVLLWGDSFAAHYVPGLVRREARIH
ncbi:MAG TPA: acyltransferase family protein, partial [Polyangiaceae bacterium]|nr:acyltransferase family protein [Polyangiaceae bacterium]